MIIQKLLLLVEVMLVKVHLSILLQEEENLQIRQQHQAKQNRKKYGKRPLQRVLGTNRTEQA